MKNKWLLISSVSTALGIIAGSVYLLFAEHSLLLSNNSWVLSAFWSAFVLWTFVLMFIVALIFNIMAFFELDDQRKFFGLRAPLSEMLTPKDRQQEFIKNAEHFLQQQGKLFHSSRVSSEFKCLQSSQDEKLVYLHRNDKSVDITQIRALFQQMLSADFKSGVVVSYAGFTSQAWIFAKEANIELLDAKGLKKQQKQHRTQQFALV